LKIISDGIFLLFSDFILFNLLFFDKIFDIKFRIIIHLLLLRRFTTEVDIYIIVQTSLFTFLEKLVMKIFLLLKII